MHLWAAITGLLILVTDASTAIRVTGVAGRPVTLPCTYSTTHRSVTSMCWGRGPCPSSQCSDPLIWTDGSRVTTQKAPRYMLKGRITEGNVSLTIEDPVPADSGQYCCRIEHPGWFNDQKVTFSLEIKPTRPPSTPASPRLTTLAPIVPPPTWTLPQPDGNDTVVSQTWDSPRLENDTLTSLAENPWKVTSRGLYIGLSVVAAMLVTLLVVLVTKKHLLLRKKQQQLSMVNLNSPPMTALQSAAAARVRAEDNIYTIEDNPYVID